MKKSLLLSLLCALMALTGSAQFKLQQGGAPLLGGPALAQGNIWFSYCTDNIDSGVGYNSGYYLFGCIEMPESTVATFTGKSVTAVSVGLYSAINSKVTIYLTYGLNETPFYTQEVASMTAGWNTVELTTPYTLTGQKVYVGYYFASAGGYPVGVDMVTSAGPEGDLLAISQHADITAATFQHYGDQFGNISLKVRLTGEMEDIAPAFTGCEIPTVAHINDPFAVKLYVTNYGALDITSATVDYKIDGGEAVTVNATCDAIPSAKSGVIAVDGLMVGAGTHPVEVTVKAVNGVAIAPVTFSGNVTGSLCVQPRMMVCEEGTGTWCGWCPRGIVGLDYMKTNYPNGFIGIAAHNGDEMQVPSYNAIGSYLSGYPGCQVNRNTAYPSDPSAANLESCYKRNFNGAIGDADIKLEAEWRTVEHVGISVKASTLFGADKENAKYSIAFVLIENKVGPYNQANYYAGGNNGELDGWESAGSPRSWLFDDVARWISNYAGDPESLPTSITAGEWYDYSSVVPTDGLYNSNGTKLRIKKEDIEVVALVLCSSPRSIVQAIKIPASEIGECSTGLHYQELTLNNKLESFYAPGTTLALDVTSSLGLPVSYTVTEGADLVELNGNEVTFLAPGAITIVASQPGDDTTLEADPVTIKLACKNAQEIIWDQDLSGIQLNEEVALEAYATSELKVTYKLSKYSSGCKVTNGVIKFTKPITVTVIASQAGNDLWGAAESVSRDITCEDSGIETISIDEVANALVFDINGCRVTNPEPGQLYIVVKGLKAHKVYIK